MRPRFSRRRVGELGWDVCQGQGGGGCRGTRAQTEGHAKSEVPPRVQASPAPQGSSLHSSTAACCLLRVFFVLLFFLVIGCTASVHVGMQRKRRMMDGG